MEGNSSLTPIAHVQPGTDKVHDAVDHLIGVACTADAFAQEFRASAWARLAGQWHDLGKFSQDFQKYIRGVSGYEAHLVDSTPGKVNHSSAGALYSMEKFGLFGLPLAYLIAGHHAGLPDWFGDEHGASALEKRLQEGRREGLLAQALAAEISPKILAAEMPPFDPSRFGGIEGLHLWIRMLFSCLVDADFLDTEAFMDEGRSALRSGYPAIETLRIQLNEAMHKKAADAVPSLVNTLRGSVRIFV